ncbi:SCO0930 family lipoprotein [Streptomyces sp. NPDC048629]|uniref:SCO0930 family lipoprotein n=1 Tax=Streptomyces sp. NPDC048629 TaxID=3154824 RepID=UPI00342B4814
MKQVRGTWVAVTVVAAMVTAACGTERPAGQGGAAAVGAPAQPAAGPPGRAPGRLAVWPSKELGKVLTDSAGFTLYRFDKDTAAPSKSVCDGDCAKAWPPVPAGATAPAGVDPKVLGSVTRADGTKQLTVGGWPMYRFAQDKAPRDVKGQGVGGTWFAAAPDGKKAGADLATGGAPATKPPAPAAPSSPAKPADLPGLSVRNDPKLGRIVVDSRGFTVYRFTKDKQWPMTSACVGACLDKWPAVAPVDENDTKGITLRNFLVLDRPDGVKQQTINCWAVYTFAGDTKPGDTNGQGVGGTWFAVAPDGKAVKTSK